MTLHASVEFFDTQFQRQIAQNEFALNPFEQAALPHLCGRVLDFGCGMGNLALHAARTGHEVLAYDASPAAIAHLQQVAREEALPLRAAVADLREMRLQEQFDTVVCIGLLMFFDCPTALAQLAHLQSLLRPGGVAVVNVLTEGTTYMGMFSPEGHCLFKPGELLGQFDGWRILVHEQHSFPAPGGTVKAFDTVIAQRT
ncbi:methyltransferase domain-containing protein [Duganella sp. LX20W]|uniref:Methyltransferase domain-containing protein n=1 Tax=Rugamonas brunnea TaxID=2758569 RepID=A0A7W2EW79_9BURK|nr:methyltransferase domain-containing protein [Rugamonas brunnea]MBA5639710.1 methyltransferase domain-containing protein [Rugamonas brunnea]